MYVKVRQVGVNKKLFAARQPGELHVDFFDGCEEKKLMKLSVVVHSDFAFLKQYIESIPERFENLGNVLYKDRNVIKLDEVNGLKLVIKSYGRIYLTNQSDILFSIHRRLNALFRMVLN